jgi:hypothetical protein
MRHDIGGGGGGGICQYIDPCTPEKLQVKEVDKTFRLIRGSSHNTGGAESSFSYRQKLPNFQL